MNELMHLEATVKSVIMRVRTVKLSELKYEKKNIDKKQD